MDHQPRIHRQRIAILSAIALAALLCFVPLGRVPLIGTLREILLARKVALGLCGAVALMTLLGRWRKKLWLHFRICSYTFIGAVVAFCLLRIVVLSHRTLPTFADDDPRAAPYYQKACDEEDLEACEALGVCYWTGTCGVGKDAQQGLKLFREACDAGDMGACGHLGVCYEMGGCGLMRNDEQAMAYYEKACTGGEMDMCNNLGVCYYEGRCGVAKDDAEAAKLYEKACRGGYSGACYNLDLIKN
ncbi:MAG: tetratricopeptide repeat protein [Polyangia bacterium]